MTDEMLIMIYGAVGKLFPMVELLMNSCRNPLLKSITEPCPLFLSLFHTHIYAHTVGI